MTQSTSQARGPIDAPRLAAMLKALASPVRLQLLQALRAPRLLSEIRLRPARKDGRAEGRSINRVSVRGHLESLLRIGAVRAIPVPRDGRLMTHYVLDYGQLFALTQELQQLARLQPEAGVLDGTMLGAPAEPRLSRDQPRLVLANGIREGQAFPLRAEGRRGQWLVGRSPEAGVLLEYDPYVSMENSRINLAGGAFTIVDLPASRNGTAVNWRPLAKNAPCPLANGDVVTVGRSTLVFQA